MPSRLTGHHSSSDESVTHTRKGDQEQEKGRL
jgi:hypothetical protein